MIFAFFKRNIPHAIKNRITLIIGLMFYWLDILSNRYCDIKQLNQNHNKRRYCFIRIVLKTAWFRNTTTYPSDFLSRLNIMISLYYNVQLRPRYIYRYLSSYPLPTFTYNLIHLQYIKQWCNWSKYLDTQIHELLRYITILLTQRANGIISK